jgi:hypothetical protein
MPSNLMLSLAVYLRSRRCARVRSSAVWAERAVEVVDRGLRRFQQFAHQAIALRVGVGVAPLADLGEPVVQGFHQQAPALGVVQQVVLQVGIALHRPRCRRAPRTACAPSGRCGAPRAAG